MCLLSPDYLSLWILYVFTSCLDGSSNSSLHVSMDFPSPHYMSVWILQFLTTYIYMDILSHNYIYLCLFKSSLHIFMDFLFLTLYHYGSLKSLLHIIMDILYPEYMVLWIFYVLTTYLMNFPSLLSISHYKSS